MSPSQPADQQARTTPSPHQPASPEHSQERRPSQSEISEDSQTVLIDTPSSLETSTIESSKESTNAPRVQPSSAVDEPRKCWICFSDETEDTPETSEWVSPCPCVLKAHQSCLLDWVADLQSPKRKKAKKVQCPQCKSDIRILQPHSLSIETVRAVQRMTGNMIWPAAGFAAGATVTAGLILHGFAATRILLGKPAFDRFFNVRGGHIPWLRIFSMSWVPVVLITSRTNAGDHTLSLLPLIYLATPQGQRSLRYPWSWSPSLWLSALPVLRSIYFGAYRRYALPLEKAWLQQIQPRAGESTDESEGQQDHENGEEEEEEAQEGGPLDMDFELGVQIEVEAVEEEAGHHHHHDHHHMLALDQEVPLQDQRARRAENPEPANNENGAPDEDNQNEDQDQNEEAQPEQPQRQPQPRQPFIQNFFFAIPGLTRMSMGALIFPWVSYSMGHIIKVTLPKAWLKPPGYWARRPESILQSQFGRSLVGGCLFVVLKDALFLYSKYSMAQNHKKRKVLNYSEIEKPWYQKNIDELITRK